MKKWKVAMTLLLVGSLVTSIPVTNVVQAENQSARTTTIKTITSAELVSDNTVGNDELTYKVYLPKGYDSVRAEGYPVLYLLHGSNGTESSWDNFWGKLDGMIEDGVIEPVIAIVPKSGNSYWVNSNKFGAYESAIINDLIPEVDQNYNTIDDRSGRYILGYSMGGYGALRYAMQYPELFKATTLLSPAIQRDEPPVTSGAVERGSFGEPYDPALWTMNNYPTAINHYVNQSNRVPVYIVAGDDDWNHLSEKEDLPSDAYKYNMEVQAVKLYEELHRKNLFNQSFDKWADVPASPAELRIINGGHDNDVWLKGFEEGLKYMFGKPESVDFKPVYSASNYAPIQIGTTATETFEPASLLNDTTVGSTLSYKVYLPHDYDPNGTKRYPVMYLLHGSGGNANSWNKFWPILDTMIQQGEIPPVIAVAPVTGNSYWVDSQMFGAIESAVIQDLIPKIDNDYKTIDSREGRGVIGFSMGGYGALRYSLVYPQLFGGATLLSPAIQHDEAPASSGAVERGSFGDPFDPAIWDAKNYPAALIAYGAQSNVVPMFIMTGDDDWNHLSEKEDLPGDASKYNMEVQAVTLYQHLHRVNLFNKPFDKWEDVPASPAQLRILNGGHDMEVWAAGFEQGLPYMFANGLIAPIQETLSTAPTESAITIVNRPAGQNDTVTVTGLVVGDIVKVYDSATGGNLLGSVTTASGQTSTVVSIAQLGASAGRVYVSVSSIGKGASARTAKDYAAEADSSLKPFTLSGVSFTATGGIKATVTVMPTANASEHSGDETVVFQLMRGLEPVSIVAIQQNIGSVVQLTAHFNVTGAGYSVKVFVVDQYDGSFDNIGASLAATLIML